MSDGFGRRRADVVAVLVGGVVFAVCAFVAHNGRVSGPERTVFEAINGLTSAFEQAGKVVQYRGRSRSGRWSSSWRSWCAVDASPAPRHWSPC